MRSVIKAFLVGKRLDGFGSSLHNNCAQKSADTGRLLRILLRAYVLPMSLGGDTLSPCIRIEWKVGVGGSMAVLFKQAFHCYGQK